MASAVRFTAPAPGTIKNSIVLIVIVLIPGSIAAAVGGSTASLTVGLCCGAAMSFSTVVAPRQALLVTATLGLAAAVGVLAQQQGSPWVAGAAVALVVLATAPANSYSAGMLLMAPILTLVFAVADRGWPWWEAAVWGVVGGLVGLAIAFAMKFGQRPPAPLDSRLAWHHAIVLAVAVWVAIGVAGLLELDHGYWVAVTLLVVLRPVPGERRSYVVQRLAGTLLGALVALAAVLALPESLVMVAAFVFLVLLAAYAMSGNYFMQTLFLTPMLLLFLTAADEEATIDLTVKRAAFTLLGALIAGGLVVAMEWWDRRSGLLVADEQGEPRKDDAAAV